MFLFLLFKINKLMPNLTLTQPDIDIIQLFSLVYLQALMSTKQIGGYTVYLAQVLGTGSFGNVYKGKKEDNNQEVAVKIIPKNKIDSKQYLKASLNNQIKILQSVKSQNIVGFYDVMESSSNYYIIQQLCNGDLAQLMKPGQKFPEQQCVNILTQICNGFLALVREGITHRDLKPANIMIRGNTFKIGDFGFSKQFPLDRENQQKSLQSTTNSLDSLVMHTTVGTPLYMSLQILKSSDYTSKCDIWALGFIFYEMLHGQTPWKGSREYELALNIEKIPLDIKRKDLSAATKDFLVRCLKPYEKDRICWKQVFLHPIFKNRFKDMAGPNKEFQNQMKTIMTKLRFYFNLNKNNLENYLSKYGFMNHNEDLNFEQYFDFLKAVNPTITKSEAAYIFQKTDTDNSGAISIEEIVQMLKNYGIEINPKSKAPEKLKEVFIKLHKIIVKNNLSLKKVFNDFDKLKKGNLNFIQFKTMVQKMSKDISDEQAKSAFKMVDQDGSDSLEYTELEKHYRNINQLES